MNWFYKIDNEVKGPVEVDGLTHAYKGGEITAETLVRREDFEEWKPLGECFDIEATFAHHNEDAAGSTEGDGRKVIENRVCAHTGEIWPEHLMVKVNDQWVAKTHLMEFQTGFITQETKKRKIKNLIIALAVVVVACLLGGGGYLWWAGIKAEEARIKAEEEARLAASSDGVVDTALKNLTANAPQTGEDGTAGVSGGPPSNASAAFAEAEAAMAEQQQMSDTTGKLLDTFGVTQVPGSSTSTTMAAPWSQQATSGWPTIMLRNKVMISSLGIFTGGRAFLLELPTGKIIGIASVSFLSANADPRELANILLNLPKTLQSWEMHPPNNSIRKVKFGAIKAPNDSVLELVKFTNGNVILVGEGLSGDLPGAPVMLQNNLPVLGEMVYVLVATDRRGQMVQEFHPGAVIERDEESGSYALGIRQGLTLANLIGSPVMSTHGLLVGLIASKLPNNDPRLDAAGVIKIKVTPSSQIASLLN